MRVSLLRRLLGFLPTSVAARVFDGNHKLERLRHGLQDYLRSRPAPHAADATAPLAETPPIVALAPAACDAPAAQTAGGSIYAVAIAYEGEEVEDEDANADADNTSADYASNDDSSNDGDDGGSSDSNGDGNDHSDEADGDEELDELSTPAPSTFTLDYALGESPSLADPAARALCDFQREYNNATIRLHALDKHTACLTDAASAELQQLCALLERLQCARPVLPDALATTPSPTAAADHLELGFRKLEKLICNEIEALYDHLVVHNGPSSSTEVAATFDLEQPMMCSGSGGSSGNVGSGDSGGGGNEPPADTTPYKEDHTHRGILFQQKVPPLLHVVT